MDYPGPLLAEAVDLLERTVDALVAIRPRPAFDGEPGRGQFRFERQDSQLMQILKAVRVVSGLRGAMHLISVNHHQEAACLLRVVEEALLDIDVIDEGHHSGEGPRAYQQALVDEFFLSDDSRRMKEVGLGRLKPLPRVGRKKKNASLRRTFESVAPGRDLVPDLEKIAAVLDGYVHCAYAQTLEMYSVSGRSGRFHMHGIYSPERIALVSRWSAQVVHHALNSVIRVAIDADLGNRHEQLIDIRNRLEASPEYPSGDPD